MLKRQQTLWWMVCSTEQTSANKGSGTQSLKMMDLWDYYNSLDFGFCFSLYLSPRTESLYLFFTQALGIQLWGGGGEFCCSNKLF